MVRRFLVPRLVVTLYYLLRFQARVSPHAEVEPTANLTIGPKSVVGSYTKIKADDGPLVIGTRVDIANGVFIAAHVHGITIGDDSLIGPNVSIVGNNYAYQRLDVSFREQGKTSSRGIRVGRNVLIGAGCCLLDGADVGDGVILAPNSVVSSSIPANAIAQGNPAKVVFVRR